MALNEIRIDCNTTLKFAGDLKVEKFSVLKNTIYEVRVTVPTLDITHFYTKEETDAEIAAAVTPVQQEVDQAEIRITTTEADIAQLKTDTAQLQTDVAAKPDTFLKLTDTPNTYTGQAGLVPHVKADETGIEFKAVETGTAETFISDVTEGGITTGDSVTVGTISDNTSTLKKLLQKIFFPTFTIPSFTITHNAGTYREIGENISAGVTVTVALNRGAITGKTVAGVWQPATLQDYRSGLATEYQVTNNVSGTAGIGGAGAGSYAPVFGMIVIRGTNQFTGQVTVAQGPQPVDSKGNAYDAPYAAATLTPKTTSFEGVYPIFGTVATITAQTKQALVSMRTTVQPVMVLAAESGGNKQKFWIAKKWVDGEPGVTARPLSKIEFFNTVSNQYDTTNQLSTFTRTETTITVQGAAVDYYEYTNNLPDRGALQIRLTI